MKYLHDKLNTKNLRQEALQTFNDKVAQTPRLLLAIIVGGKMAW